MGTEKPITGLGGRGHKKDNTPMGRGIDGLRVFNSCKGKISFSRKH